MKFSSEFDQIQALVHSTSSLSKAGSDMTVFNDLIQIVTSSTNSALLRLYAAESLWWHLQGLEFTAEESKGILANGITIVATSLQHEASIAAESMAKLLSRMVWCTVKCSGPSHAKASAIDRAVSAVVGAAKLSSSWFKCYVCLELPALQTFPGTGTAQIVRDLVNSSLGFCDLALYICALQAAMTYNSTFQASDTLEKRCLLLMHQRRSSCDFQGDQVIAFLFGVLGVVPSASLLRCLLCSQNSVISRELTLCGLLASSGGIDPSALEGSKVHPLHSSISMVLVGGDTSQSQQTVCAARGLLRCEQAGFPASSGFCNHLYSALFCPALWTEHTSHGTLLKSMFFSLRTDQYKSRFLIEASKLVERTPSSLTVERMSDLVRLLGKYGPLLCSEASECVLGLLRRLLNLDSRVNRSRALSDLIEERAAVGVQPMWEAEMLAMDLIESMVMSSRDSTSLRGEVSSHDEFISREKASGDVAVRCLDILRIIAGSSLTDMSADAVAAANYLLRRLTTSDCIVPRGNGPKALNDPNLSDPKLTDPILNGPKLSPRTGAQVDGRLEPCEGKLGRASEGKLGRARVRVTPNRDPRRVKSLLLDGHWGLVDAAPPTNDKVAEDDTNGIDDSGLHIVSLPVSIALECDSGVAEIFGVQLTCSPEGDLESFSMAKPIVVPYLSCSGDGFSSVESRVVRIRVSVARPLIVRFTVTYCTTEGVSYTECAGSTPLNFADLLLPVRLKDHISLDEADDLSGIPSSDCILKKLQIERSELASRIDSYLGPFLLLSKPSDEAYKRCSHPDSRWVAAARLPSGGSLQLSFEFKNESVIVSIYCSTLSALEYVDELLFWAR